MDPKNAKIKTRLGQGSRILEKGDDPMRSGLSGAVSSENLKKARVAPRSSDRFGRFGHMWTSLSTPTGPLRFGANNSERF